MTSATAQPSPSRVKPRASDHVLVGRVALRDAEAFEELYRRHSGRALMLARKLCPSREAAEEIVQESFISLWRSAHRYRPGLGSVTVWLASIVRNRAIDAWRRAAVRPVEVPVLVDGPGQLLSAIGADAPAPERAAVLALIAELPGPQKEAVFLAYFGDMTHDEIARWANAPLGTVKGRIRMGLQKLRSALEEQARAAAPALERTAEPAGHVPPTGTAGAVVGERGAARRGRAALSPRRHDAVPAGCGRPAA